MSQNKDNSIDALVKNAEACLKDKTRLTEASISEVSFWLLERDIINVVEQHRQLKDISEIKPCSKIDIELSFRFAAFIYRLTIKATVTESGVFQLGHAELTDMQYPYSPKGISSSSWKELKTFVKENSVGIADLLLSLFNMALTLMQLGQQAPGIKP